MVVRRVLFDGTRTTGVEVESGGEIFTLEGEEIILSAGAIASPQLLMLSGIGPPHHLRSLGIPVVQESPGVGQNLRDHPNIRVPLEVKDDFPMDPKLDFVQKPVTITSNDGISAPPSVDVVWGFFNV